jgi:hypothetical protein
VIDCCLVSSEQYFIPAIFTTRTKKSLRIPKGYSESVNRRRDNTMTNKGQKKNEELDNTKGISKSVNLRTDNTMVKSNKTTRPNNDLQSIHI